MGLEWVEFARLTKKLPRPILGRGKVWDFHLRVGILSKAFWEVKAPKGNGSIFHPF